MPKTKQLKSQGWGGVGGWVRGWCDGGGAREAFGEKEEGGKKEGVERRERECHPPTQTLKNGQLAGTRGVLARSTATG